MKTSLRRLFNYWLPPGHSSDKETPNPLVEVAVKIQASTAALLAGAEVDWDEINRENEEWWRLTNRVIQREGMVELTRLTEEMGGYDPEVSNARLGGPTNKRSDDEDWNYHRRQRFPAHY